MLLLVVASRKGMPPASSFEHVVESEALADGLAAWTPKLNHLVV
jgi:hypothetical protein